MTRRLSLRWRLILFSWSLALGTALALLAVLQHRNHRQLLAQVEKTLETKCDEVITLLRDRASPLTLSEFLKIETNYRFSPYTYFYVIRDGKGGVVARSANLGGLALPLPEWWPGRDRGGPTHFATVPHPIVPATERIRLRSERVELAGVGPEPSTVLVQTAVSLAPVEAAVRATLRDALLVAAGGLAAVLFLLWFATTWSLRPVTSMTRKASKITATSLRERLPLAGRNDELDELASVLNDMLDRLGASLRQMEQFSSDAAHQLRTPLTRIRGELDLILAGDVPAPLGGQLEKVQEELERLSRVCGRLLLLARLDQQARDASLLAERVDLDEVVSELLDQMTPVARDRGVALRRGASSTLHVRGSRPLLVEALLNLLDNAIRVTPPGEAVAVSIDGGGGTVRLCVEDRGPGVAPEERESVFLPFYRVRRAPSEAEDEGSGLGLAIVRGIAQAHGGRVEIAPAPERGSVFRLVLPLAAR